MRFARVLLVVLVVCLASSSMMAGNVGGGWVGFCFGVAGTPATNGCQNDASSSSGDPFTFTLGTASTFRITDAFKYGDTFDVYDHGSFLFTTSAPCGVYDGTISNPDAAWADSCYSKGSILLGAGFHSIDVFAHDSPWDGGGAYLNIGVPEPASLMLLGAGILGIFGIRRKW